MNTRGHLTMIYGPMNAGKTEKLKATVMERHGVGRSIMLINSVIDMRSDAVHSGILSSHNKHIGDLPEDIHQVKCRRLSEISNNEIKQYDIIAIDESQFFEDILMVKTWVLHYHKTVIVSGLLATSEGTMFGDYYKLLPFASKVKPLSALCTYCMKEVKNPNYFPPAIMTKCLVEKSGDIHVSSNDFAASCIYHWLND